MTAPTPGSLGARMPAPWDQEPPIEEVRAEILRKIEAMERHEREQEARRALDSAAACERPSTSLGTSG